MAPKIDTDLVLLSKIISCATDGTKFVYWMAITYNKESNLWLITSKVQRYNENIYQPKKVASFTSLLWKYLFKN